MAPLAAGHLPFQRFVSCASQFAGSTIGVAACTAHKLGRRRRPSHITCCIPICRHLLPEWQAQLPSLSEGSRVHCGLSGGKFAVRPCPRDRALEGECRSAARP